MRSSRARRSGSITIDCRRQGEEGQEEQGGGESEGQRTFVGDCSTRRSSESVASNGTIYESLRSSSSQEVVNLDLARAMLKNSPGVKKCYGMSARSPGAGSARSNISDMGRQKLLDSAGKSSRSGMSGRSQGAREGRGQRPSCCCRSSWRRRGRRGKRARGNSRS